MTDQRSLCNRRFWLKLTAGLLFAVVACGGAYASIVTPTYLAYGAGEIDGMNRLVRSPVYPRVHAVPEMWIRWLFAPAHWADERMRPGRWISHTDPPRLTEVEVFRGPFLDD